MHILTHAHTLPPTASHTLSLSLTQTCKHRCTLGHIPKNTHPHPHPHTHTHTHTPMPTPMASRAVDRRLQTSFPLDPTPLSEGRHFHFLHGSSPNAVFLSPHGRQEKDREHSHFISFVHST